MNSKTNMVLFWLPRVLSVLLTISLLAFLLDAADEISSADLFQGLAPVLFVALMAFIGWKSALSGGIVFLLFGIMYIAILWNTYPITVHARISIPMIVIGALFITSFIVVVRKNKQVQSEDTD